MGVRGLCRGELPERISFIMARMTLLRARRDRNIVINEVNAATMMEARGVGRVPGGLKGFVVLARRETGRMGSGMVEK